MKLFQYKSENKIGLGALINGKMLDLTRMVAKNHAVLPATMDEILQMSMEGNEIDWNELEEAYATLLPIEVPAVFTYLPPITVSSKILCIGLNYMEHREETGMNEELPFPTVFCKFSNALLGAEQPLHLPRDAAWFDYEAELVIVIGKKAKNVNVDEAADVILGYTVGNDFSARDLQLATPQWTMGKACDEFAPVGPFIVPEHEIDATHLDIRCRVNGQVVQDSNTCNMIFKPDQIVSYLSKYITLMPGDLIFTGTPSGVILGKPESERVWLKAGDRVEVEIDGIGSLRNVLE